MIRFEYMAIVCVVLVKAACGQSKFQTRLLSVNKKPSDAYLLFSTSTNTPEQCYYVCINNRLCSMVVYRASGSFCRGYTTTIAADGLGEDEAAKQVLRQGRKELADRAFLLVNAFS